jgi:type IV secretory pathway VirJ component
MMIRRPRTMLTTRSLIAATALSMGLLAGCAETPIDLHSDALATPEVATRLAHLPLIEVPALRRGDTLVILYTGDNGWAMFDRRLSAALADAGTPTVGVSTLRYFLQGRSQDEAAKDLAAIIDHYSRVWKRRSVVLVGYSYGADTLSLIAQDLPADARAKVRLLALISPADYANLTFRGASWFDLNLPGALPIAPALARLNGLPVICIRADRDPRAACSRLRPALVSETRLPGGHHYEGQEEAMAATILAAVPSATARR